MNDEIEDKEALYTVIPTTLYKKELKKYLKQPKKIDKIEKIVQILIEKGSEGIPTDKSPHMLVGNYKVEIVGSKSALFFNKAGDPIGNY